MPYTIPNTTVEVHRVLSGHVSPETAYVVEDYPYGFRLRCRMRYWLDFNPSHGTRLVSQTTNPKRPGEVWNKPKASTYARFGGAMFLDADGHVQWHGLTEYTNAAECLEWAEQFRSGVPEGSARKILDGWIAAKVAHEKLFIGVMPTGFSYCDKRVEVAGDYKRAGFLPFDTLALKIEADCADDLRDMIARHAAKIEAKRGQEYRVSTSGQTVLLGGSKP